LRKIAKPTFHGICSTDIIPIAPCEDLDRSYLFHFLRSARVVQRASALATGANLPRLSPKDLLDFEIPLPTLDEQRRTAAFLDHVDDLRLKRGRALDRLDALGHAIFLDTFGDPQSNVYGWPIGRIGTAVQVIGGFAFRSEDFTDAGNGIIRISNLTGDGLDTTDLARIPQAKLGKGDKYKLRGGDILMAMSGATTGKLGVVPTDWPEPLFQNQRVGNFRVTDSRRIDRGFLIALINGGYYQSKLWNSAGGAAQANVSARQLEDILVFFPPIALQLKFGERMAKINEIKALYQRQAAKLIGAFESLEHRVFQHQTDRELAQPLGSI
jgi:type I restriction enzyme S subunit